MTTFDAMRALGEARGWKLDPPNPGILNLYSSVSLSGVESGVPIRLERVAGAELFTTLAALDPPLPVQFAITHEGLVGTIANFIGFHDVQVGDPTFDKAFRIVAKDATALKQLLTPELRHVLTKLHAESSPLGVRGFHVSEHGVSLSRSTSTALGDLSTPEQLLRDVPLTIAVVLALKQASTKTHR